MQDFFICTDAVKQIILFENMALRKKGDSKSLWLSLTQPTLMCNPQNSDIVFINATFANEVIQTNSSRHKNGEQNDIP